MERTSLLLHLQRIECTITLVMREKKQGCSCTYTLLTYNNTFIIERTSWASLLLLLHEKQDCHYNTTIMFAIFYQQLF